MFTPADRSAIRPIVIAALEGFPGGAEAFAVASAADQLTLVKNAVEVAGLSVAPSVLAAFVMFGRLRSGIMVPGSPEHLELRLLTGTAPKPWHKPNAPTSAFAFMSAGWSAEFTAVDAIASQVSYEDTRDQDYDELIAAYVRAQFGFGGLQDYKDDRAVGLNDPTMRLFIEGVKVSVRVQHASWFDGSPVVDGRSLAAIKAEAEAVEKARKLQEASDRRAKRVAEQRAAYAQTKDAAFSILLTNGASASPVFLAAQDLEFAAFFETFNEDADLANLDPAFEQLARLLPSEDFTKVAADDLAEATKQDKLDRVALVVQFLFSKVNAAHPTWFRELENSDLKLRKVPLKEKVPTLSRAQQSIRNHLYDDVEKYGEAEFKAALEAIFGHAPGALGNQVLIPRAPKTEG